MKSRKLGALCLVTVAIFTIFALTGCQLAREDGEESQDRLIGVFLTTSHLDLGGANMRLQEIVSGAKKTNSPIDSWIPTNRPQGRLYATLVDRTLTNEETGATTTAKEYIFQDIEGISFFTATVPATEDHESYTGTGSDAAISDVHTGLHYKDNEETIEMEGIVHLSTRHSGVVWYINPVYQGTDGSVYVTAGNGLMHSSDSDAEGVQWSTTLKETVTITENGKAKSASTSVKLSLSTMHPPEQIAVIQMGEGYNWLESAEYAPTEVPSTLVPRKDTQFIVVETRWHDPDGRLSVSRSLYGKDDNSMPTFYCRDDGVCVKQHTELKWSADR